jgi:hypothetical protein
MDDPTSSRKILYNFIRIAGIISLAFFAFSYYSYVKLEINANEYGGGVELFFEYMGVLFATACIAVILIWIVMELFVNRTAPARFRKAALFLLILLGMEACPLYLVWDGHTDLWLELYLISFVFVLAANLLHYIDHRCPGVFGPPDAPGQEGTDPGYVSWWDRDTPITGDRVANWNIIYTVTGWGFVNGAVLFSFIVPGLGQTYNGQYLKGGIFLTATMLVAFFFGPPAIAIWLLGTAEAALTGWRIMKGKVKKPENGLWVGIHMCMGGCLLILLLMKIATLTRLAAY